MATVVEKHQPAADAQSTTGAFEILVRSIHAHKKAYDYHLQLTVGIGGGSGGAPQKFLPLSLWNKSTPSPPEWWDEESSMVKVPHTHDGNCWTLADGSNSDYIALPKHHQEQQKVKVEFRLQKVKHSSGNSNNSARPSHKSNAYPAKLVISLEQCEAPLTFGETATVVVCIKRVTWEAVNNAPHLAVCPKKISRSTPIILTVSDAADEMRMAASQVICGSRVHKLLSEWGGVLDGVGGLLAPLVQTLPFGELLVTAAASIFGAVMRNGAVMELVADICGQTALMLRVLAQASVQRLIIADPSTHALLEKLVGILQGTVHIVHEYRNAGPLSQLWNASNRLDAFEETSKSIHDIFTLLSQLTTFRVQADQAAVLGTFSERIEAMRALQLLTADQLTAHLLPQLVGLLSNGPPCSTDGPLLQAADFNATVQQMHVQLRDDVGRLTTDLLMQQLEEHEATLDDSLHAAVSLITKNVATVVEASGKAAVATLATTMRSLLDDAMGNVIPQSVKRAVDDAFKDHLADLHQTLIDVIASTWASTLQKELELAGTQVQEHTVHTIDVAQLQVESQQTSLGQRLDAATRAHQVAAVTLTNALKEALDEQLGATISTVRDEAASVRASVADMNLSAVDRIAVLHVCFTEVTSEFHVQHRILEKMYTKIDELYDVNGKLSSAQIELTEVLNAIPIEIRNALAPDMQRLCQQLRFHDASTKSLVFSMLEHSLRSILSTYSGLKSMQHQHYRKTKQLIQTLEVQQQDMLALQREQRDVSNTILAQQNEMLLRQHDMIAMLSGRRPIPQAALIYDASEDSGDRLSEAQRQCILSPLEVLRMELRCLFSDLHAHECSTVAPGIELNRMMLYTSLRIVQSVSPSAHKESAADNYEGASMDSSKVLTIMEAQDARFLLVEGRAGIGKTTWAIHLAQLQDYRLGVVVFVRLSEVAQYLEGKATNAALSPRELLYISFGCDTRRIGLVERVFFSLRLNKQKIVWLIDGLDEVISNQNVLLKSLIKAIDSVASKTASTATSPHMFGAGDVIVVTSREERGGAFSSAQFIATINPWSEKEAVSYVRSYFAQQGVRNAIFSASCATSIASCVDRAITAVREQRFGSFSTLPIVLEMLCWSSAINPTMSNSVTELYENTINLKISMAQEKHGTSWSSSPKEIVDFCKVVSRSETVNGVFFTVSTVKGVDNVSIDLIRSGLVRECFGATITRKIVRFIHKSFLEYFQALYFSEHLDELSTTMVDFVIPTAHRTQLSIECLLHTSRQDIIRVVSDIDTHVEIELECCRSLSSDICVVWLTGESERAMFAAGRTPTSSSTVSCVWDHRKCNKKILSRIPLQKNVPNFLVVFPKSGGSIVPVRCTLTTLSNEVQLHVSLRLPLCDIPGYRQQRNFFQFLTEMTKKSDRNNNKKAKLLSFLIERLQYYHSRVASSMDGTERSLVFSSSLPTTISVVATSKHSKASALSDMGLAIVTECAACLENHDKFGKLLERVKEATSLYGGLCESLGIRSKVIFEWALLPVARYGTWAMWMSLEDCIPKKVIDSLSSSDTVLQEALVASMMNNRQDITKQLVARNVRVNLLLACRLGATSVVQREIKSLIALHKPQKLDEVLTQVFTELFTAAQFETANVVWDELAAVASSLICLWNYFFSYFINDNNTTANAAEVRNWLIQQWSRAAQTDSLMHSQIEQHAIQRFPPRLINNAINAGIVTANGLLCAPNHYVATCDRSTGSASNIVRLHFTHVEFPSTCWSNLLTSVANVRHLNVHSSPRLHELLNACRASLEELSISCNSTPLTVPPQRLDSLRRLALHNCVIDESLVAFLCRVPTTLQATQFDNAGPLLQFNSEASHATGASPHIAINSALSQISTLPHLQSIDLSRWHMITGAGVSSIAALMQLQHLDLSWCDKITDAGVSSIAALMQLQHLELRGCKVITDAGVSSIAALTQLQYLDLSSCDKITDAGVSSIAALTQLQYLNLSSCDKITDAGVSSIAALTQLQHLNLSWCKVMTDAGVSSIATLTLMQCLDLSRCENITDAGVRSNAALTQLRHLNLRGCNNITDAGV
ncbi:receptor-type protein kinase, putative, partial [Bodo saltans]